MSTPEIVRTEYDMAEVVRPPSLPADALAGWKLFVQRCALCHDPLGQPSYPESFAPVLTRETVSNLGEARVRAVILGSSRMPWRHAVARTDREVIALTVARSEAEGRHARNPTAHRNGRRLRLARRGAGALRRRPARHRSPTSAKPPDVAVSGLQASNDVFTEVPVADFGLLLRPGGTRLRRP